MAAATFNWSASVVHVLLDAGANLEARDEQGMTPLMLAARGHGNPDVLSVLLDAGADGTARNSAGQTAFDLAGGNDAIRGTDVYWRLNDARFR